MEMMRLNSFLLAVLIFCFSCNKKDIPNLDYAEEMRSFVINLSNYAKDNTPSFIVIPQNASPLIAKDEAVNAGIASAYVNAIDGQGQEDLYYGYKKDDKASPDESIEEKESFLDLGHNNGLKILVTDYCYSPSNITDSYSKNESKSYISFAATERELNVIPSNPIHHVNNTDVSNLSLAKNFLYLINPEGYESKKEFVDALDATKYDVFIIDLFFNGNAALTASDLQQLQSKPNGARRLVIAYMSIGEAEDYRFYWDEKWNVRKNEPIWLYEENKQWKGNYKVFYWEKAWQNIIFGNQNAYLDKIMAAGFDGVYLDIIDAYEFFQSKTE